MCQVYSYNVYVHKRIFGVKGICVRNKNKKMKRRVVCMRYNNSVTKLSKTAMTNNDNTLHTCYATFIARSVLVIPTFFFLTDTTLFPHALTTEECRYSFAQL